MLILLEMMHHKALCQSDEEGVAPKLFDISALLEGTSMYYIYPEETNMFLPKEGQNVVSAINILMNFCFSVENNVVHVEDILHKRNVENMLTDAVMYNARIWFHYISWALKIRLENLNGVNNCFTWMKCFTWGCHNMAKSGILK